VTLVEATSMAAERLAAASNATRLEARREARLLLHLATGLSEASQLAHPEREVDADAEGLFLRLLERRAAGEPFAYLAGRREFYGLELAVDRRVLVPRPETEHLVEAALEYLAERPRPQRVLDLGVGSGAVAVALAAADRALEVLAVDVELGAAVVAQRNLAVHHLRVPVLVADWADALAAEAIDLVVSNPPYIALDDPELAAEVQRHEPHRALFAGSDGLLEVERLLTSLERAGCRAPVLCEIGSAQEPHLEALARRCGRALVRLDRDLAGLPRIAHFSSPMGQGN
jgi:release factor glutamine methyltransferase